MKQKSILFSPWLLQSPGLGFEAYFRRPGWVGSLRITLGLLQGVLTLRALGFRGVGGFGCSIWAVMGFRM